MHNIHTSITAAAASMDVCIQHEPNLQRSGTDVIANACPQYAMHCAIIMFVLKSDPLHFGPYESSRTLYNKRFPIFWVCTYEFLLQWQSRHLLTVESNNLAATDLCSAGNGCV